MRWTWFCPLSPETKIFFLANVINFHSHLKGNDQHSSNSGLSSNHYLCVYSRICIAWSYLVKVHINCLIFKHIQIVRPLGKFGLVVIKVRHGNIETSVRGELRETTVRRGNVQNIKFIHQCFVIKSAGRTNNAGGFWNKRNESEKYKSSLLRKEEEATVFAKLVTRVILLYSRNKTCYFYRLVPLYSLFELDYYAILHVV